MANHYRQFSVAVRLHGKLAAAWITDTMRTRRRHWQQLVEKGYEEAADDLGIGFDWSIDDDNYLASPTTRVMATSNMLPSSFAS